MKLISRYLVSRLALYSFYALAAILALYSFIDLLAEINNIGKGTYTTLTAFKYTAMQSPARAYQLMPLATLIGGLAALSQLSGNSELPSSKPAGWARAALSASSSNSARYSPLLPCFWANGSPPNSAAAPMP